MDLHDLFVLGVQTGALVRDLRDNRRLAVVSAVSAGQISPQALYASELRSSPQIMAEEFLAHMYDETGEAAAPDFVLWMPPAVATAPEDPQPAPSSKSSSGRASKRE